MGQVYSFLNPNTWKHAFTHVPLLCQFQFKLMDIVFYRRFVIKLAYVIEKCINWASGDLNELLIVLYFQGIQQYLMVNFV